MRLIEERPIRHNRLKRNKLPYLSALSIAVLIGCLGGSFHFTPEQDEQALTRIEQSWVHVEDGLTLTLCEDLSFRDVTVENECQTAHIVKGDGYGEDHTIEYGGGCGGCPFSSIAYVNGVLESASETSDVTGHIVLGDAYSDDAYALPYHFELTIEGFDTVQYGSITEDGDLIFLDPTSWIMTSNGAVVCPE